jgi:GntP family gluconate:H+ symporter
LATQLQPEEPIEQITAAGPPPPAETPEEQLPPLWLSVLPVLLPVLLISSSTIVTALERTNSRINQPASIAGVDVTLRGVLGFFGNAGVALLISALVGMAIVAWRKRLSRSELGRFTSTALDEAGMILLITSAGGAFGDMLQQVGVGQSLGVLADRWNVSLLVLGWALAAMLKAAQGSATVAMITAAGILKAILDSNIGMGDQSHLHYASFLGYHPVYLVMAIGCGSKIGSWMNDSGFWVVCKAGGLTEIQALRSWTLVLATMGVVGLPITWLFAWLLPLQ